MLALYGTIQDCQNFLVAEDADNALFIVLFIFLVQRGDPRDTIREEVKRTNSFYVLAPHLPLNPATSSLLDIVPRGTQNLGQ